MRCKLFYILLFTFISLNEFALAQNNPDKADSSKVYKEIEAFSKKRKLTKLIYSFIFRPVTTSSSIKKKINKYRLPKPYSAFEGKIIRQINIVSLDPFGYSISDTSMHFQNFVSNTGNTLHIKTKKITIRNHLLFRKFDTFDSLLVKESERLIRSQSYVRDVSFIVKETGSHSDSVDISIRVMDVWSIVPDGSLSTSGMNIKLTDKNLAGLGHNFSNDYSRNFTDGKYALASGYSIPNIRNSHISTRLNYVRDEEKNYLKSLNFERPFFSPLTRWAGGILFAQQLQSDSVYQNDSVSFFLTSRFNTQDYWAAGAWQVLKGNNENKRTTKLIVSARVLRTHFLEKPDPLTDPLNEYSNEIFYLCGLGISSRKYVQDKYIFKFGITEDVPVGRTVGLIGGYQVKNGGRWYWGLKGSWGNFYSWGYFGCNLEYGTFANASKATQGVFVAGLNYFTALFEIGNWKFRQFVKPELTIGLNRSPSDRLTINDGYGLTGFNSAGLTGSRRMLFTVQTQSYAPWNFLGFKFGPYLNFSLGMLGESGSGFKNSKAYTQFGIGTLIKNEFFVLNTFQISIAFYPSIPGDGNNVFRTNPLKTNDFGFRDFEIGKPSIRTFE